jgi:hypothetical protein
MYLAHAGRDPCELHRDAEAGGTIAYFAQTIWSGMSPSPFSYQCSVQARRREGRLQQDRLPPPRHQRTLWASDASWRDRCEPGARSRGAPRAPRAARGVS